MIIIILDNRLFKYFNDKDERNSAKKKKKIKFIRRKKQ